MKNTILLFSLLISVLFSVSSCKDGAKKNQVKSAYNQPKADDLKIENKTALTKENNVFEINQAFLVKTEDDDIISKAVPMDLSNTKGCYDFSLFDIQSRLYTIL